MRWWRRGSGLVLEVVEEVEVVEVDVDVKVDVQWIRLIQHEMLTCRLQMIL